MAEPRRRFRFLKELAQGGFGKVYLAEMITGENFSSIVAIKLLHGRWLENDEVVARSRDEARLLGRLRHRNIVRVEDLTAIQGQCAIVMEYLQGVDLKTICNALRDQEKPFPRQAMFEVAGAIASALDAAYNQTPLQGGSPLEVIHRDIKPSNAMITIEGDIKVLDFGTARARFEDREAKTQALSFGSAAYMAPERLMGEEDRPAGDIFSLGITLYEMLTLDTFGKIHIRPEKFEKTVAERLAGVDFAPVPASHQPEVREFLRTMLHYEHEERPSAATVVERMETFSEMARDGGLKRFARERVKAIIEAHVPEQDPTDAYNGREIFEDSGLQFGGKSDATDPVGADARTNSGSGPRGRSTSGTSARPTGSGAPAGAVSGASSASRVLPPPTSGAVARPTGAPSPTVARANQASPSGARNMPLVQASTAYEEENPFQVPADLAEAPAELPVGRPTGLPPTPPPMQTVTPRTMDAPRPESPNGPTVTPRPEPSVRVAPAPAPADPVDAPSGGGLIGKLIIGVGLLGILGAGGAAVVYFLLKPPEPPAVPENPPKVVEAPTTKLPSGAAERDFAPNAAGKGGVILTVPAGASEVAVTSSTGFHAEWDGTQNLRLRDLEPGVLRGKVKPKGGGPSLLADFSVEGDTTCVFTFNANGGGSWDKSDCR